MLVLFVSIPSIPQQIGREPVLDLRDIPAAEKQSLGVPGSSVGGPIAAKPADSPYDLPLQVRIKKLGVQQHGSQLTLEVQITNSGKAPLAVPSCTDAHRAHEAGSIGRRTLNFGVAFDVNGKEVDELIDVTFGADTSPKCYIQLKPGNNFTLIDDFRIPSQVIGARSARVFLQEWRIENKRYYIQGASNRIYSQAFEFPTR